MQQHNIVLFIIHDQNSLPHNFRRIADMSQLSV
jgi:hypothetical protein